MSGFAFAVLFVVVIVALVVVQELLGVVVLPLWELVLPDSVDILPAWGCAPLWDTCLFLLTKLKLLPCAVEDCVDVVVAEVTWDDKLDDVVVVLALTDEVVAVVVSKEEAVVDPVVRILLELDAKYTIFEAVDKVVVSKTETVVDPTVTTPVVRSLLAVDASVDADVVPAVVGWNVVDCKVVVDGKPASEVNPEVVPTVVDCRLVFAVVTTENIPVVVPAESDVVDPNVVKIVSEVVPLDTASEVSDWVGPCVDAVIVESRVLPKVDELTADTVDDVTVSIVELGVVWVELGWDDWTVVLESRCIKMDDSISYLSRV